MSRRGMVWIFAAVVTLPIVSIAAIRLADLIEPAGNEEVVVVLKTTGPHMEFWQIVRAGIQAAADELNVDPTIVGPRYERDVDQQIEILAGVVEQRPDAILLAASDYNRLVPFVEEAREHGITIVTLDSALNSDIPVSFVATDNVAAGVEAGTEIDRLVGADTKIAIISHIRGVATAIDREAGVVRALQHRPPKDLLGPFYVQNDLELAYETTVDVIEQHPDLGGIVALNENSTVGAGRAIRDLGLASQVMLVGFDNSKEEIEFLEDDVVQALVVQRPFNMGYVGITTLVEALRGERVEPIIYTDAVLVRKGEMFTEENQKLLFPIVQSR